MWFSHSILRGDQVKFWGYPRSSQNNFTCSEGPMTFFEREVSARLDADFIFLFGRYLLDLFIDQMAKLFVGSSQNKLTCFDGPMAFFEREVSARLSQLNDRLNLIEKSGLVNCPVGTLFSGLRPRKSLASYKTTTTTFCR